MPRVLKAYFLVAVASIYLVIAFTFPLLARLDQRMPRTGFERLSSNRLLVGALLTLIVVALAELILRSPAARPHHQAFWGGVFVGVGLSVCLTVDPGFGMTLSLAGGCLANFREIEPGAAGRSSLSR